jgi:hypothetical protein
MDWQGFLSFLKNQYDFHTYPPAAADVVETALLDLQLDNDDVKAFYCETNGLSYDWFRVFPIEDPKRMKHTWDGIKRANNPQTSKFLAGCKELLERFVVFAQIGGGKVAVIEKNGGSIWYQEDNDLHITDLTFSEFLELCLKEVTEL